MGIRPGGPYLTWLWVVGIVIALLGVIHLASTPGVMRGLPEGVPGEYRSAFLFMFVAAGTAVLLAGVLVLWAAYGLARQWRGFWMLALVTAAFTIHLGGWAIASMPRNPFSYGLLAAGLLVLPPLILPLRSGPRRGEVLDFRRDEPADKRTIH